MKKTFVKLHYKLCARILLVFIFLFFNHRSDSQNIIQNGDFQSGLTPWVANSQFWNLATSSNSGCVGSLSQYVYHGNAVGTWANNTYGSVYQEITIPANTISATLQLKLSVNTEETTSTVINDILDIQFRSTTMQLLYTFGSYSNLEGWNASSCKSYKSISFSVPSQFFGQTLRLNFQGTNNNSLATIFRIDEVALTVTAGPTSCVTWRNGILPSNQLAVTAAEYLCQRNIISNSQDVQDLLGMSLSQAADITVDGLYNGNRPSTLPSDNIPTLVSDILILPFYEYQAVKALCYLEGDDGRACINRDFYTIQPKVTLAHGKALRMLLEGWNITPDTVGYDVYSHSPSSFLCNVLRDNENYGYFKKAYQLGLLNDFVTGGCFNYTSPGEFFYIILYKLLSVYGSPVISQASYFNPNNFDPKNIGNDAGIERAVFQTYEQSGFVLPSNGLGIDFNYSYHSNLLEYPTTTEDMSGREYGNLENHKAVHKNFPVGKGWTHSYNIYANILKWPNSTGYLTESALFFHWGDGNTYMYNLTTSLFETKGVYDDFVVDGYDQNGALNQFHIITKDRITYKFYRSNNQFYCTNIIDRNNNTVSLFYEQASCAIFPSSCVGSTNARLIEVAELSINRKITFNYQQGTDLLYEVKDNIGRSIKFYVNKYTYNLDSLTNANGNTTIYKYCNGDTCNNMLVEIQRPKGNWIKNTYSKRKLKQTQTPNYTASINFSSNYTSGNQNTSSVVQTIPTVGVGYSTTYQHNALGQITSISDPTSNTTILYNDGNNPALPTSLSDNLTGVSTNYEYDLKGNVLVSTIKGGSISQITKKVYNSNNDITRTTLPNGSIFNYTYNSSGNLISESGPLGYGNSYTRNPNGTLASNTKANGVTTKFDYNGYGNLSKITIDGTSIISEASYDAVSRITQIKNANGSISKYVYDANDNIVQTIIDTSELKLTTTYKFDKNDNCDLVIAPKGDSTRLTFDSNDDLVKEDYGNRSRAWGYYDDGSLKFYQDKNGHLFSRQYFPTGSGFEGLLQQKDGNTFEYYPTTKLLKLIQEGSGKITFNYDALNRVTYTRFEYPFLSYAPEINYEYDISGFQTKLTIPSVNKYYKYVPDPLNRISDIYDWNNSLLIHYDYRSDGNLNSEKLGNGASIFYHYDIAGRLDSIYAKKSDGSVLYSIGATLDGVGNHIQESYYVNKGTLSSIIPTSGDPSISYVYDNSNRLLNINSQVVTNDNAGNVLNNGYSTFTNGTYDFREHLSGGSVDGKTFSFLYDPFGNRFRKDTILYIQDLLNNGNVLAERTLSDPTVKKLYCHSPLGLVCSIDQVTNQKKWYLYDFRGSTVAILGDNQNVVEYYKYDPFGTIEESSITPGNSTRFLYVGKYGVEYHSPHLYYMRARCYDPSSGRFYGEDPVWNINLFVYANNNPVNYIDPFGNASKTSEIWNNNWNDGIDKLNESLSDPATYELSASLAELIAGSKGFNQQKTFGGRLGNQIPTRRQLFNIGTDLESAGWTVTHGGGRFQEEYFPPLTNSRKGGSYVDLTATHPSNGVIRINTVDTYRNGSFTKREIVNAQRIRKQIGSYHGLKLIPKTKK